jgi:hypothetical protein
MGFIKAAGRDSDHYLVVAEVRERLSVSKRRSHIYHTERMNLMGLNEVEGKEQYCVEVSKRFAALEGLDAEVEMNSGWEMIREIIKMSANKRLGYFELKHKPWFDKGCSKLLGQRKQAKLQWLQDPSETNADNLKIVTHEAIRYFRNRKEEASENKVQKSINCQVVIKLREN